MLIFQKSPLSHLLLGFAIFLAVNAVVDFFSFALLDYALDKRLMFFRIPQLLKIYVVTTYLCMTLLFVLWSRKNKKLPSSMVVNTTTSLVLLGLAFGLKHYRKPLMESVLKTYLEDPVFTDHMLNFNIGLVESTIDSHLFYGFIGFLVVIWLLSHLKVHISR